MIKALKSARLRASLLLSWVAVTLAAFGFNGSAWYQIEYLLDEMQKSLALSGAQSWPIIQPLLWLEVAAALVCAFTPKALSRVLALILALFTCYSTIALGGAFSGGTPNSVASAVSKASGISDQFTVTNTGNEWSLLTCLAVLVIIQLLTAFSIHVSPANRKTSKYENSGTVGNSKSASSDPISLWDARD